MRAPRRSLATAAVAAAALTLSCGSDGGSGGPQLRIFTRNLYLGADLTLALLAETPTQFTFAVTEVWQTVQKNDFTDRAKAIAAEIVAANPDLVGLQEVALWRTQSPGDAASGGTTPATTVAYDFLELLLGELRARGASYTAAVVLELTDIEAPILDGSDVRFTDRGVILARDGVSVSQPQSQVYQTLLPVSVVGRPLSVKRGFTRVEVAAGGQTITFVNTHLESTSGAVRTAQASELMQALAGETGRVLLVGDLNSSPGTEGHLAATQAGFTDAWTATRGVDPGFTCCFPGDLTLAPTPSGELSDRIDLVLTRGPLHAVSADVVGETPSDRSPGGRWPSDHAGVVATVQID
ncbi:MAG TPA: endonuclease/exonuclease/phosphatase family protein [Anaeromyxobacteraceae bacterium]|nr:endonuclease/exonuclease/phosphatase family protein [Anaeromyxobacteraceae bacterium]